MHIQEDIEELADRIGERNCTCQPELQKAADYITAAFAATGREPSRQEFQAQGKRVGNIELEIRGTRRPADIYVVGAHYDTAFGTPGANANASGVAVLLALARHFARNPGRRTLRLAAFVNGERPFARTPKMGAWLYASRCRMRGEAIEGMLSLESLGAHSVEPGSQWLSLGGLLLPRTADFLALVGNRFSQGLLNRMDGIWQNSSAVPVKPLALPAWFPGVSGSGSWAFWQERYPALLLTDTARLRYPHHHKFSDTPDKLAYDWLEAVTAGLIATVGELIGKTDEAAEAS